MAIIRRKQKVCDAFTQRVFEFLLKEAGGVGKIVHVNTARIQGELKYWDRGKQINNAQDALKRYGYIEIITKENSTRRIGFKILKQGPFTRSKTPKSKTPPLWPSHTPSHPVYTNDESKATGDLRAVLELQDEFGFTIPPGSELGFTITIPPGLKRGVLIRQLQIQENE